jgi:hypothetical protein
MFMKPQITERQAWARVTEKTNGYDEFWVPVTDVAASHRILETKEGVGARLSAPGYLDATEWTVCVNAQIAARYLLDAYFDTDSGNEDPEEAEAIAELERIANNNGDKT